VTPYCNGGKCSACSAGLTSCSGVCTNLSSDNANCGACGNVCAAATPYCSGGKCSACSPGLTSCGSVCTNLDFDNANCGACGVVCPSGTSCQGVCLPLC
jgi:hypothetical protein